MIVKRAVLAGVALFTSALVSLPLTFLLAPFWRWLEAASGIESIGHSGPAAWCYAAVFGLCLAVFGTVAWMVRPAKQTTMTSGS